MKPFALAALLIVGCATTPRPVPAGTAGSELLTLTEALLTEAPNLSAKFEIESEGENAAKMTGTIRFYEGNAIHLVADGHFRHETVQLLVDSRDSGGTSRSTTKGPSVSSHRDPPAPKLREAVALGLARMGLLHNLASLSMDRPIDGGEGGFGSQVKAVSVKDGHSDTVAGTPCRRVDFDVEVEGRVMGDASVCVADATGLPVQRRQVVHFPAGDMKVTETFTWEVK